MAVTDLQVKVAFLLVNCTDLFDTQPLSNLLKAHKDQMVQSLPSQSVVSVYRLNIRRKRMYEDKMTAFMHGFPLNKQFSVTFISETAVDTGGPLREFLF